MELSGDARQTSTSAVRSGDTQSRGRDGANITDDQIRNRAYEIYLRRGGTHGADFDDWLAAERELRSSTAQDGLADRVVSDTGVLGAPSAVDAPATATAPASKRGAAKSAAKSAAPAAAKSAAKSAGTTKSAAKSAAKSTTKSAAKSAGAPTDGAAGPAESSPGATAAPRRKPRGTPGQQNSGGNGPA